MSPHLATQVYGGSTVGSLFVQSVARSDEVTDIGDVDPDLQQTKATQGHQHEPYALITGTVT